jgi:ribokinase
MERPGVVVFGSINVDTTFTVAELPETGETVIAKGVRRTFGGKGLNQAIAAARHDAPTAMIACIGDDGDGDEARRLLAGEGISTAQLRTVPASTGAAAVVVDSHGENVIIVAPSANDALDRPSVSDAKILSACGVLLCQLEVPLAAVAEALRTAREHGAITVLNAAPASALPPEMGGNIQILVVNAGEARAIAATLDGGGSAAAAAEDEFDALLAVAPQVIVTRGPKGADYLDRSGQRRHIPAPRVEAVDSTGAGDAFCGALCAGLAAGMTAVEATELGVAAGARAVQHRGTHVSRLASVPSSPQP